LQTPSVRSPRIKVLEMKTPRYPIRPRIRGIGRGTERVGEFEVLRRSTPRQTRRSPPRHWPVLPPVAVPIHLTGALRTQPPSGRLRRCPDATRSPTRCAARAVPAGSGQSLVVFSSLKTLLVPTKASALRRNRRPRASFSLAGFETTLIGRRARGRPRRPIPHHKPADRRGEVSRPKIV
jgi:hypothetical protein